MGEEVTVDRNILLSKIGTFFIVISIFAIIIFVASDVSRNDPGRKAGATQTFIVESVQALQTRDAGAALAAASNLPTPTLAPAPSSANSGNEILAYFPVFCFGSVGLFLGWFFKRISAPPSKPSARFEGLRKMREKQREAKARKEGKKEGKKEAEKEAKNKK